MADGYYWKLTVKARKGFNPDQPRVPAGNPRGGQWTAGTARDFVQLQQDIRNGYPQPVRDAVSAKVYEHYADREIDEHDVQAYLDVMSMSEEHFRRYGEKIGLQDIDGLWEQYSREGKAVDAEVRKRVAQMKDALAYKWRLSSEAADAQVAKWDKYYGKVGASAAEATTLLRDRYGIKLENFTDIPNDKIHQHASFLLNMAAENPAIATILKEQMKNLRYEPRQDTAAGKWRDASGTLVVPYRSGDFPIGPSMFAHELGHAAENYVGGMSSLDKMGFGQGRAASLYGAGNNPSEDWAEWFLGAFAQTPGLRGWDGSKYDRVRNLIESLGGTKH